MRRLTFGFVLLVLVSPPVYAQDAAQATTSTPPSAEQPDATLSPFTNGSWDLLATVGAAYSVVFFISEAGHRYAVPSVSIGRVLSDVHGPGLLRGNFTWALEVVPLFEQWAPMHLHGIGVAPIVWRWNFAPYGRRVSTYTELAAGGLWTSRAIPTRTTSANFTAHAGYGLRYFLRPRQALVMTYWLHHISNGNRLERNPGINAHVLQLGYSYMWRR